MYGQIQGYRLAKRLKDSIEAEAEPIAPADGAHGSLIEKSIDR
jgi:hypothetical protein